jgi:hypothetical protein
MLIKAASLFTVDDAEGPGTLFFDTEGRLTECVAQRYAGVGRDLETWSAPIDAKVPTARARCLRRAP